MATLRRVGCIAKDNRRDIDKESQNNQKISSPLLLIRDKAEKDSQLLWTVEKKLII
jgi:hypothetical protein